MNSEGPSLIEITKKIVLYSFFINDINVWVKKTKINCSSDTLLRFVFFFDSDVITSAIYHGFFDSDIRTI